MDADKCRQDTAGVELHMLKVRLYRMARAGMALAWW